MQSIDSIETCAHAKSKDLVSEKEEIKCKKREILIVVDYMIVPSDINWIQSWSNDLPEVRS